MFNFFFFFYQTGKLHEITAAIIKMKNCV